MLKARLASEPPSLWPRVGLGPRIAALIDVGWALRDQNTQKMEHLALNFQHELSSVYPLRLACCDFHHFVMHHATFGKIFFSRCVIASHEAFSAELERSLATMPRLMRQRHAKPISRCSLQS